jgi:hypothetical protein
MASHTKSEPVDRTPSDVPANLTGASSRVIETDAVTSDAEPPSGALASSQGPVGDDETVGDDEDVSLDELMMSDSNDGDELAASGEIASDGSAQAEAAVETPSEAAPESSVESAPYSVELVEDDEAAALAAAAAAQEAAAAAAAAEADARMFGARRASETSLGAPRASAEARPRASSSPPPPVAAVDDEPAWAEATADTVAAASTAAEALEGPPASEAEAEPAPASAAAFATDPDPAVGREPAFAANEPPAAAPPEPASTRPAAGARRDAPLPSFDIPEVDSANILRGLSASDDTAAVRNGRALASPLQLSEVAEDDDDDAVTHIGLPVVPESPSDYADLSAGGFQPVDPGVAAMQGLEPDLSLADARRATTRLVPRIDVAQLEQRRARVDTNPALTADRRPSPGVGEWLSSFFKRGPAEAAPSTLLPAARRRSAWLLDTVLPYLSLVLFGSGIGAGIMLLQTDRGARAAQQSQTVQALQESPAAKAPTTLAERAEAGDGDALFKITNMAPGERSSALTLALERGHQAQKQNEFKEFARQLEAPSGLSTPNLVARFLSFATSPETMLPAFAHLLGWPGTTGPDVLYAVWEKAPGGSRAASLAQQLLHSADQRAKATPALVTALDLRSATSCEDYLRVLPAVQRDGDQRCSATLRALKHRDGCGDDGQKDCFACLRDSSALDDALKAIEGRAAPQL